MFFNEVFKEMDRAFGEFSERNEHPESYAEGRQFPFQPQPPRYVQANDHFRQNETPQRQYNYNFRKTPKSEKDIFDV